MSTHPQADPKQASKLVQVWPSPSFHPFLALEVTSTLSGAR